MIKFQILKKNSYPSGIIEQFIKSFLSKLYVLRKVIPTAPNKDLIKRSLLGTVGITFLGTESLFKKDFMNCSIIPDG